MVCSCGSEIPKIRFELGFHTCINCSTERPKTGMMVYDGKVGGRLVIFEAYETEAIRQAERFTNRRRK